MFENRGGTPVRRVNDQIRQSAPTGSAEPIPFLCECGDACFHPVWLSALGYDELTKTPGGRLVAPGHRAGSSRRATESADQPLVAV